MIAALATIVIACLAGWPIARFTDRDADRSRLLGESYLFGLGILALVMFATTGFWSQAVILIVTAAFVAIAFSLLRSSGSHLPSSAPTGSHLRFASLPFHIATALTLTGYAIWSTLAPLHDFDFLIIWGLKARQFFEHGGIDWQFLTNRWYPWSHHDYPVLLPLTFDYVAVLNGAWDDRWLGLLYVAFAAALLLIVYSLLREELASPVRAAIITLILAPLVCTPWPGRADGPVAVFGTAGLLLARRAWRLRTTTGLTAAAILLGLGGLTKNEGVTLVVAAVVALLTDPRMPRRTVLRLWPAVAVVAPWMVVRALFRLPTDLAEGDVYERLIAHLGQLGTYAELLSKYATGQPLLWIGIALGLLIGVGRVVREERIIVVACAIQLAFFIGAYLVTPADLEWHVRFSWERLVAQITPLLVILALVLLAPHLGGWPRSRSASTEAPE